MKSLKKKTSSADAREVTYAPDIDALYITIKDPKGRSVKTIDGGTEDATGNGDCYSVYVDVDKETNEVLGIEILNYTDLKNKARQI